MTKYHHLTQEEKYIITGHSSSGKTKAEIARLMGRHPSTIRREFRRNATTHDAGYRAEKAHSYATARKRSSRRRSQFSAEDMAEGGCAAASQVQRRAGV